MIKLLLMKIIITTTLVLSHFFTHFTFAQVENSTYVNSFNTLYQSYSLEKKQTFKNAADAFLNLNFFYKGRGMMISPGLINLYNATPGIVQKKAMSYAYGLNFVDNKTIGLFSVDYEKHNVGVLGCVACHSGQAAGYFIVGLGNKNVDVYKIGSHAFQVEKTWSALNKKKYKSDPVFRDLTDRSLEFIKVLANSSISNQTQGLVPTALIQTWFYKQAQLPLPQLKRGAVKVPALWGYESKRKAGQFSDGFGDGSQPGWGIAVELTAGQTPENVMEFLDKIHHAEDSLHDFLPPKYPFKIDLVKADRGKILFQQTCQKCHGAYERNVLGEPIFMQPKWIPHSIIKTDVDRSESVSEQLLDLVANNPLNSIIKSAYRGVGYFSPRLEGIWSRFPYLHNASIPTIWDLLQPVNKRPVSFSLKSAGERDKFDEKFLGLKIKRSGKTNQNSNDRSLYDTTKIGQTNVGHEFGLNYSMSEKLDIIEYLKTL